MTCSFCTEASGVIKTPMTLTGSQCRSAAEMVNRPKQRERCLDRSNRRKRDKCQRGKLMHAAKQLNVLCRITSVKGLHDAHSRRLDCRGGFSGAAGAFNTSLTAPTSNDHLLLLAGTFISYAAYTPLSDPVATNSRQLGVARDKRKAALAGAGDALVTWVVNAGGQGGRPHARERDNGYGAAGSVQRVAAGAGKLFAGRRHLVM